MIVDMHAHIIPENFPPAGSRPSAWTWPSMDHFERGRARVMIGGENYRTVHDGNWNVERRLSDMKAHGADVEFDPSVCGIGDVLTDPVRVGVELLGMQNVDWFDRRFEEAGR